MSINVVLSGIYYPMAMLSYFRAALKRRQDVNVYEVGPYTGTWIPWNGGMNLPTKYAIPPDKPLSQGANRIPIHAIEAHLPFKPDLWLQVDAGFHFVGRPTHGINVIVGTDPHCLNYDRQRSYADIFYCMQSPYIKDGDKYLPYAYDPVWHRPEEAERKYDVALCGMFDGPAYCNRRALIDTLRHRGVNVFAQTGPVFDEARQIYASAPIAINWSSQDDLCTRVFELLAMRRLAVVNRVTDLAKFFDDSQLVVFDSLDEAVTKTEYFLNHPAEAESIAERGYQAVQPHSWGARVNQVLEEALDDNR